MVAGGHDNNGNTHDSTELLVGAASEWVYSVPLPRKIWSLQGVTAGGILYMAGKTSIYLSGQSYAATPVLSCLGF